MQPSPWLILPNESTPALMRGACFSKDVSKGLWPLRFWALRR